MNLRQKEGQHLDDYKRSFNGKASAIMELWGLPVPYQLRLADTYEKKVAMNGFLVCLFLIVL